MACTSGIRLALGRTLVRRSARFDPEIRIFPAATASLILWNAIDTCFFFKVDSGNVLLLTTDSLSQNTLASLLIGNPNILNSFLLLSVTRKILNRMSTSRQCFVVLSTTGPGRDYNIQLFLYVIFL